MSTMDRDQTYILHMLECIARVEQYVNNDRNRYDTDPMVQDAVLRTLQVMAESSQRLSDQAKTTQDHPRPYRLAGHFRLPQHLGA